MRVPYLPGRHPSATEMMHGLLGISESYARDLIRSKSVLPSRHALRIAEDIEAQYGGAMELARELREYARQREASIGKHVPSHQVRSTKSGRYVSKD